MSNELYHYGVLGMKWGVRKAKKRGKRFDHRSFLTKIQSAGASAGSISPYVAVRSHWRDNKMLDYAKKTSTGATVARHMLMGPVGSRLYERSRSIGYGKGKSALISALGPIGVLVIDELTDNKFVEDMMKRSRASGRSQ